MQLRCVDLLKFLMAFSIVACHAMGLNFTAEECDPALGYVLNLSVKFFFVASGYFLGLKLRGLPGDEAFGVCRRRSRYLLGLFALWVVLYLPLSYQMNLWTFNLPFWTFAWHQAVIIIFRGQTDAGWSLWFLLSLAISVWLIGRALRRGRSLVPMMVVGALAVLVYDYLEPLLQYRYDDVSLTLKMFSPWRVLTGLLYTPVGIYTARVLPSVTSRRAFAWAAVAFAVSVAIYIGGGHYWEILGGWALFVVASRVTLPPCGVYLLLRRYSIIVFLVHMQYGYIYEALAYRWHVGLTVPALFWAMSLGSLLTAVVLERLSRVGRLSFLNRLF